MSSFPISSEVTSLLKRWTVLGCVLAFVLLSALWTAGCDSAGPLNIVEGTINLDPSSSSFGVPEELVVNPQNDFVESISCQGVTVEGQNWWSAFLAFHSGAGPGPNEADPARGGFVITDWEPGTGGTTATKTYDRSFVDGGTTLTEETQLEIRMPTD